MRSVGIPGALRGIVGIAVVLSALAVAPTVDAADVPAFMKEVVAETGKAPTPAQVAFDEVYALNEGMITIYETQLVKYKRHIRERVPLIMGLFSGKGGRFILYKPGQAPIEAPSPPPVYQLAKSVGHSAMATYQLVAPTVSDPAADTSWIGPMKAYRGRIQVALDSLPALDIQPSERDMLRACAVKLNSPPSTGDPTM